MSKNISIKVENLSKAYQLGQIGTGTISRDLERWYARMRRKEDPFLKIGERNNQNAKSDSDVVWSLKDINFEIEQGDAVGIVGRNGAGKSTLLKILSKVTAPTTGKISGKGRIASLLEVGTGFHPELSGKENIFLNGAILGMRKKEIQRKLDEIVDFAGIERYIDTPVKRYSSGMYVRLAFAVAAHLESEILIVDEVLAVGDAEFQKKCLGKMGEVSKGEGRTVLFVSHNMSSVQQLCKTGILLINGTMNLFGNANIIVEKYLKRENSYSFDMLNDTNIFTRPELVSIVVDEKSLAQNNFHLEAKFISPTPLNNPTLGVIFLDKLKQPIFGTNSRMQRSGYINKILSSGTITLKIPDIPLIPGTYTISLFLGDSLTDYAEYHEVLNIELNDDLIDSTKLPDFRSIGSVKVKNVEWHLSS
ncbi:ABC transporter ATP-binding protein [Pedobacter sp.]|uniref:ABC transporter ATP-binding protein n=1 Tax=Pedobacter sp. TaxID=1411316 RepID=UPI003BA9AEA2